MTTEIVIDATNGVLGRIASFAAKQSLLGKRTIIVNCSDSIVVGSKGQIIQDFKIKRARGGTALKGPDYPRIPERIMKRTVRGMLPYKQEKGRLALKRVICYNNTPPEYAASEKITFNKLLKIKPIKLSAISKEL